jgi:hypothetical protein
LGLVDGGVEEVTHRYYYEQFVNAFMLLSKKDWIDF